jgi:uncharacterized protein YbaP (TraB family)
MSHITFNRRAILICLIGMSCHLFAQDNSANKKNYALLWEITGKGLTKPSYLFGTMHLRDKRVFEFSDSVLLKLESCEAFASEVRMDSAVYQQWEMALSGDTTNRLSNRLSKEGYERLLKALKMKGINIDSLNSKNKSLIFGKLNDHEEMDSEDSKDLFLDLYLTRLAYNQGKSLHGLERMEDYEDLDNSFFDQFEDSTFLKSDTSMVSIFAQFALMEEMIDVYNQGDLTALKVILNNEKSYNGNRFRKEMLDNRNTRMVQQLENLMSEKSVFCAVGAAHLPDSMGMLALLHAKGYIVRKVTPQFTGLAGQFMEKKVEKEWHHQKDNFNHFEFDMPEQPYVVNSLRTHRKRLGTKYIYYDITNASVMLAESSFYPHLGQKKLTKEKLLTQAFKEWMYARTYNISDKEKVTMGDNEGYKFTALSESNSLIKGVFYVANNNIYTLIAFFDKAHDDRTERADKFLKSFKINPLPLTDWQDYEDSKGAFTVRMPVKPDFQELKTEVPQSEGRGTNYFSNVFISKEAKEGFTYMIRYSDMPTGLFVENDSFYISNAVQEATQNFVNLKAKLDIDSLTRHYDCPEFNIKVSVEGFSMLIRAILRGNRLYVLLAQPPLDKNKGNYKKLEDWLNSFRFLPFNQPIFTQKSFPEMGLRIGLPTAIEPHKTDSVKHSYPYESEKIIQTTDNQSGVVLSTSRMANSKYYSTENIDSFWHNYERTISAISDEIEIKDTTFKGLLAKNIIIHYPNSSNISQSLVVMKDGYQYDFSLVLPYEIANTNYANSYFNTIEFLDNAQKIDLFSSKKPLIIKDIASDNDSIKMVAKQVISQINWTKEDLPLLSEALLKQYPDDSLRYGSVRINLINQIKEIKTPATLALLEKMMVTTQKDTFVRNAVLCTFLDLDTLNAANRFFELAKSFGKFDFTRNYRLRLFMVDSIERAKLYFDKMMALSEKPFEEMGIISMTQYLAQKDTLNVLKDIFSKYTPQYLSTANALIQKNAAALKLDTVSEAHETDISLLYNYVSLFKNMPDTPEINTFLKKISTTNQLDILSKVMQAQIKNKQPIEDNQWKRLSKNKIEWYYFLSALHSDSLLGKVPPQYFNQKDIAETILRTYFMDDYGDPKEMTLIETQKYKGELLYIFKCKMDYEEDENPYYVAICAQPLDKTKILLDTESLFISDALKEVKNPKKIVDELLKNHEKWVNKL